MTYGIFPTDSRSIPTVFRSVPTVFRYSLLTEGDFTAWPLPRNRFALRASFKTASSPSPFGRMSSL